MANRDPKVNMNTSSHDQLLTANAPSTGSVASDSLMKGELPRRSDAQPEVVKSVIKLDDRSMVWAHDQVASDVEAMTPFMALLMVFIALYSAPVFWRTDYAGIDNWTLRIVLVVIGVAVVPGSLVGAWFVLKIGFGRYADIHFNRRTRKVYTQEDKVAIQIDWPRVRPFAIPAMGPLTMGGLPLWSLTLIEFSATNPKAWTRQMRVQGLLPDRDSCQRVWEAIRRYMDEPPESLPALEVVADPSSSWQGAILDFGPARVFDAVKMLEDAALGAMGRLRRRHWWPALNPMILFWWTFFWPGPLSDILYHRFRPKARLPADWTAEEVPPAGETNSYRKSALPADVVAGRRKATWIIGLTCGTCIAIGAGLTLALVIHSVLPSMWELWRPLFR